MGLCLCSRIDSMVLSVGASAALKNSSPLPDILALRYCPLRGTSSASPSSSSLMSGARGLRYIGAVSRVSSSASFWSSSSLSLPSRSRSRSVSSSSLSSGAYFIRCTARLSTRPRMSRRIMMGSESWWMPMSASSLSLMSMRPQISRETADSLSMMPCVLLICASRTLSCSVRRSTRAMVLCLSCCQWSSLPLFSATALAASACRFLISSSILSMSMFRLCMYWNRWKLSSSIWMK
mmetsp:Transcript_35902/g.88343  ORF Transcript_35902/g.88343 Transcript_35902/m.88343 type:complete len:236 (-) Transcript_35902:1068-1775(-)